jgi:glycine/D-amino acid oxidase-like deaminating enzyme
MIPEFDVAIVGGAFSGAATALLFSHENSCPDELPWSRATFETGAAALVRESSGPAV